MKALISILLILFSISSYSQRQAPLKYLEGGNIKKSLEKHHVTKTTNIKSYGTKTRKETRKTRSGKV